MAESLTLTTRSTRWLRARATADRLVALVGLLVLALPLAGLAAVVAVVDRQPPIVGLARLGEGGRPFTLWKVRTMRRDGGSGGSLTVAGDHRVTRLGHHLRRSRVDELPQLWNVVRGQMALLGPRPETPEYVDAEDPAWAAALAARPGIAGATQVVIHGWEAGLRSADEYVAEVLPRKLEVDRWYVTVASPAVDLDVLRSLIRSVRDPAAETPIHRRLEHALPATMAAIRAGSAG